MRNRIEVLKHYCLYIDDWNANIENQKRELNSQSLSKSTPANKNYQNCRSHINSHLYI